MSYRAVMIGATPRGPSLVPSGFAYGLSKARNRRLESNPLFAAGLRGLGFDYSAITDCSMLTAFQRSQAPQCGGSAPTSGSGYVAPTLATPQSCIDAFGNAMTTDACVNANLVIQASNQALLDAANRAVFLKNCHDMIYQENLSRASRGLPLQVDDCDLRNFGQVAPGTTGSIAQPQLVPTYFTPAPAPAPSTTTAAPASTAAAGPVAVSTPAAASAPAPSAPAPAAAPSIAATAGYVNAIETAGFDVGGTHIPWWALALSGGALLYAFSGRR